jgi:hypothetical protein
MSYDKKPSSGAISAVTSSLCQPSGYGSQAEPSSSRIYFSSVYVWNVFRWWLNIARIAGPARRSALPRFCGFYLTCRAANAISPDNLFSKAVDAASDTSSASLAFDATGWVCVEVAFIGALSPAIGVVLIFTVRDRSAGNAPAEQCCEGDQSDNGRYSFR